MNNNNQFPQLRRLCHLLNEINDAAESSHAEMMSANYLVERALVILKRCKSGNPKVEVGRLALISELEQQSLLGEILEAEMDKEPVLKSKHR
ncbi:hypothetical protein JCM19240_2450 [Vibrio maritimus]|uniref:Uncharacterized protein n=1 Tax=Vibrio maritimus TaxID=990268 RepID=A0A090T4Q9_9VIBR|nr:hypothetical protein JCM19240_2450 [Vibrio maritimus]